MELNVLLLLALVAGIQAGPIHETITVETCAKTCTASNKFDYTPGTTYEFQYENEIRSSIQGASESFSGLHLSAKVHMSFLTKCEFQMRLSDVSLKERDPETAMLTASPREFQTALERSPVTVSFQDGSVEELCLSGNDPTWVTNVKRGILTVFQNRMDDLKSKQKTKESDVSGHCDVEYTPGEVGWSNLVIKKSKNLLSCEGHQEFQSAVKGTPYRVPSEIQSMPLMKSEHECEQELSRSNGRLQSATCREFHMFRPFSREASGAITHNTQKLTFTRESRTQASPGRIAERVPLTFEHVSDAASTMRSRKDLERVLVEVCETTATGVTPDTPRLFTNIVYILKKLEASDMDAVYQKVKSGALCAGNNARVSKMFLDAIPMAGTASSIHMMTQLITSKTVTGVEADMWLTTLAFIQKPTTDMLREVKPLLTMDDDKTMLGVSSLVNSYCRVNTGCESNLEVMKIIALLENKIKSGCKVTESNFETVLLALRAIGNAGFATRATSTLNACMSLATNPMEIRLSAIEAYRRIPCSADKRQIMALFLNQEEDSEIRISAYKTLMECPSRDVLRQVKAALESEEVNQVGSYVWSHLTNLMETSDPHKQDIRAILENETLQKEFDLDKRKFSRNYEGSVFLEKINTGAKVESDIIWSSKSFIMRSAMLNLTVDMFGQSINLFEVGGRVEGLEYMLESYFGPNGYFSDNDEQESAEETALSTIRSDKVNKINKKFEKAMDEPRGNFYMRMFGNELRYMNFKGFDSLLNDNRLNFLEMLMSLSKTNDYSFSQSVMFLDSSIIIPTSAGFPLNLTVNGTAMIDFKASGKMDLAKLASRPRSLEISGTVQPSAVVEISSMMSVDAFVTKSGIRMMSTLNSGSSIQGKVQLSDGKIFSAEWDLPQKKMDIISMRSAFFTVHRDVEREQRMITENRQEKSICTGSKIATLTGLELCGELQFPNASLVTNAPYFPITGPVSMGVTLYKRDTHSGYKFEARSIHTSDENIVRMAFTTPESSVQRNLGFDISLNKRDSTMDMSFTSPWKKADFQASVTNQRKLKGIQGKLNVDGSLRYMVQAQVKTESSGAGTRYTPNIEIRGVTGNPVEVAGSVMLNPGKMFDADITMTGMTQHPIVLRGSLLNKANIKGITASLSTQKNKQYSFESRMQTTTYRKKIVYQPTLTIRTPSEELIAFGGSVTSVYGRQLTVDLVLDKVFARPVSLKGVLMKTDNKNGQLFNGKLDFALGRHFLKLKSKLKNKNWRALSTDIDIEYVIRRVASNRVKLVSKIMNLSTRTLSQAEGSMSLSIEKNPEYNFKCEGNMNHNYKHSEVALDLRYGDNMKDETRHIEANAVMNRAIRSRGDASLDFNAKLRHPGQNINLVTKINHRHNQRELSSDVLMRANQQEISSSLALANKRTDLASLSGDFKLSFPGRDISLEQIVVEKVSNELTSITKVQFGKTDINTIKTTWKRPSPSMLNVASVIKMHDATPISIEGTLNGEPRNFKASARIERGDVWFTTSVSTQYQPGQALHLSTDVEYPDRHVVVNFEGTKADEVYTTRSDIRWNAGRDDSQRLTVSGRTSFPTAKSIDSSITLQYPSRTYVLNLRHSGVAMKYISHIDFQWEPRKVFSLDTTFSSAGNRKVLGSLKISSPFKALRQFDVSVVHQEAAKDYTTKLDVEWNPSQILSTTLTLRKPLSLKNLRIAVVGKTPWKVVKKFNAELSNKLEDSAVTTGAKLQWNRQFLQTDISLVNSGTSQRTAVSAQIDMKTSFAYMKKGLITLSHSSDGRDFQTNARYKRNRKTYSLISTMTHETRGWSVLNNGKMVLNTPDTSIQTTWNHRNTPSDIATSATTVWNGQEASFEYSGQQSMTSYETSISSTLKLMSPYERVRDLMIEANHQHRFGLIDSTFRITKEGQNLALFDGKYTRQNNNIDSNLSMNMPFLENEINVKVQSSFGAYPVTGHVALNIAPSFQLTADTSYNKDSAGYSEAFVKVASPTIGQTPITLSGKQGQEGGDVLSHIQLQYGSSETITLETRHRYDSVKRIQISLASPFAEPLKAEARIQGNERAFTAMANAEAKPFLNRWSVAMSLASQNGISGTIRIDTPYPTFSYCRATMESRLVQGLRNSNLYIEYMPTKRIEIESTYNLSDMRNLKVTAKLVTPFSKLPYSAIDFYNRGDMREFSNHAEIEYQRGKKITAGSTYTTRNGMEGSLTITTPFSRDITGSFRHSGNMKHFQSHIEMLYKDRIVADLNVNTINTMKSQMSIQTSYPGYENLNALLVHNGNFKQFQTNVELSNGATKYTGEAKLETEPQFSTEVSFETPNQDYPNVKLSLNADGNVRDFTSKSVLTIGSKALVGDLNMRITPDINVDLSIQSPFSAVDSLRGSMSHQGTTRKFRSHAELSHSRYGRYSGDFSLDLTTAIAADVSVTTPQIENLQMILNHEGHLASFHSHAEFIMGEKKVSADATLKTNPFSLDATLSTPFDSVRLSRVNLKHDGTPEMFKSHAEFQLNKDTSVADLTFNMKRKLDADLTIRSPYIEVVKASIDHWGSFRRFSSRVRMSYGRTKKLLSVARFQLSPTITGQFEIKSPFALLKRHELSFKHAGGSQGFTCNLQYNCNGKMFSGDATLQNAGSLKGEVNLKGHSFSPINVKVVHTGTVENFHSNGKLSYGTSKQIQADISFDMTQAISGSFDISSPFPSIRTIHIGASHASRQNNYNTHGEIEVNGQRGQVDIVFARTDGITATMTLATPFRGFETITASLKNTFTRESFTSEAQGTLNGENIEGRISLTDGQIISGSASLRSSLNSISNIDMSLHHDGTLKRFNSQLELTVDGTRSNGEMSFDMTNNIEGSMKLNIPLTEDISFVFSHGGPFTNCKSRANLSIGSSRPFDVVMVNTPEKRSLTINTPFEKFETTEISVATQGRLQNFRCQAEASIMRQKGEIELTFASVPSIESRLTVKSSMTEDIAMQLTFEGLPSNFRSVSDASYGQKSLFHQETNVKLQLPVRCESTVSSPVFGRAHILVTNEGTPTDFKTHFESSWNKLTGSIDAVITVESEINIALRMKTPFNGYRNIETNVRHSRNQMNLRSHADLSIESTRMNADVSFASPEGTINIVTPFTEDLSGSITLRGTLLKSRSHGLLSYGNTKLIEISGDYNLRSSPMTGDFTLLLPIQDYESTIFSFSHEYEVSRLSSRAQCTFAGKTAEVEVTLRTRPNIEGSFHVKPPMTKPIKGKASLTRVQLEYQGHAEISVGTSSNEIDVNVGTNGGSVSLKSPFCEPLFAVVNFNGQPMDFQSHAEFNFGQARNVMEVALRLQDPIKGSISVETPVMENMKGEFNINTQRQGFQSHTAFGIGSSNYQMDATLQLDRNQIVDIVISCPHFEPITVKVGTEGRFPTARYNGHLKYGRTKQFEFTSSMSYQPQHVHGEIMLTSPMMSDASFVVDLTGTFRRFTSHAELSMMSLRGEVDASLDTINKFNGKFRLSTSLTETIAASLENTGSLKNFECHAEASLGNRNNVVDLRFNAVDTIEGRLSVTSVFCDPILGNFVLSGPLSNLKSNVDISYAERQVLSIATEVTTGATVSGKIGIEMPMLSYRNINAAFSHSGLVKNFNSHGEFSLNGLKTEADIELNVETALKGKISLKAPVMKNVDASFNCIGPLSSFRATSELSYGNNVLFGGESTFSKMPFKGTIRLTTPFQGFRTMSADFTYAGAPLNFRSHVEGRIGQQTIEGDVIFNAATKFEGTMSLTSSLFSDITAAFDVSGGLDNFRSHNEFAYGERKYTTDLSMGTRPELRGTLSITTPTISELGADLKITYVPGNFKIHTEGKYEGQSISGDAEIAFVNGMMASFQLRTPFEGIRNIATAVKYETGYRRYSAHGEFEMPITGKLEIDGTLNSRRGLTGDLTFKTPFKGWRQSSATFRHEGIFPVMSSTANVRYANKQYGMSMNLNGLSLATLTVTTPLPGYDNLSFSYSRTGLVSNMQANARLTFADNKNIVFTFENSLSGNRLDTKASLTTPYTSDLKMELSHAGSVHNFHTTALIAMGSQKEIKSDTTFTLAFPSCTLESTLTTVLGGHSDMHKVNFQQETTGSNFKTLASLKMFSKEILYSSSIQTTPNVEATVTLKTPFAYLEDVAVSFEHSGTANRFTSKGVVEYYQKKVEGTVRFSRYGWRRITASFNLDTPFAGFETNRLTYRHSGFTNGFQCESSITSFGKDFSGIVKANTRPLEAEITIKTPFQAYEEMKAGMKFDTSFPKLTAEANILYQEGNAISFSSELDVATSPNVAFVKLTTPFKGYEVSELRSTLSGDLRQGYHSSVTVNVPFTSPINVEGNLRMTSLRDMEYSFSLTSQIRNMESLKISFVNRVDNSKTISRFETSWAPSKAVVLDSQLQGTPNLFHQSMSLTTPFEAMREWHTTVVVRMSDRKRYQHTMEIRNNGRTLVDYDSELALQDPITGSIEMRSPRPMKGTFMTSRKHTENEIFLNWNSMRSDSNIRVAGSYDDRKNVVDFKVTCARDGIRGFKTSWDKSPFSFRNNVDVFWGRQTLTHVGYELARQSSESSVKVILPTRSLKIAGSNNNRATEGSFMWDADRDQTKKIGFRSAIVPTGDSMKADITLMMPSIGKDVQVDSEMILNRGRIIFEGKADFSYSTDERKKFSITSRLEDVSNSWNAKNYSFSLGVSHPYTSIGMQVASHVSHSNEKLSAGMDVEYLTARRQTKTINVNGEINRLRKSVRFDVRSPVKQISINGNAQFDAPFRMSMENKYDDRRPLRTVFTLDPQKRLADFNMNYDLENPTSEFHVSAKYSGSSQMVSEIYHVVNRQRVTDALLSLGLNNSHLLHSRIHWRPSMLDDLRAYWVRKAAAYRHRLSQEMELIRLAMTQEMQEKTQLIASELVKELEPLTLRVLEDMETLMAMYESNQYHTRDVVDAVTSAVDMIQQDIAKLCSILADYGLAVEDNILERMEIVKSRLRGCLSVKMEQMEHYYDAVQRTYEASMRNVTMHPAVQGLTQQYNNYISQLQNFPIQDHMNNMADKYTSAIYNTRELINANLPNMDSVILQHGKNAYKYWEVRENTEMVALAVYNYIKVEVEEELAGIREAILRLGKSAVTIYDPAHGEIQLDLYLPVPVTSLDVLPSVDVNMYNRRLQKYIPRVSLSLPSSDVSAWLPPFEAVATVKDGRTVTTFDGRTYEMDGSCTYLLAKDFVDRNFSISLNKGINRTMNIFVDGQTIEILRNGKVRINGEERSLPVSMRGATVTNLDGVVRVDGAGSFSVEFNSGLDLSTIRLNGWYFGKTAGLLGTYDNEPSNDLVTSYGRQISNTDRFARTWDIGAARCR